MGTFLTLLSGPKRIFLMIGGAALAALGIYVKGRSAGGSAAREKQFKRAHEVRKVADSVEREVDATSSSNAREELKRWSRD